MDLKWTVISEPIQLAWVSQWAAERPCTVCNFLGFGLGWALAHVDFKVLPQRYSDAVSSYIHIFYTHAMKQWLIQHKMWAAAYRNSYANIYWTHTHVYCPISVLPHTPSSIKHEHIVTCTVVFILNWFYPCLFSSLFKHSFYIMSVVFLIPI